MAAAHLLTSHLVPLSSPGRDASPEPHASLHTPPGPTPLPAQFLARAVHSTAVSEDRLTTSYWLNVPVVSEEDDANEAQLVRKL